MAWLAYTEDCLNAAAGSWPASGAWALGQPQVQAARSGRRPTTIRLFKNGFVEHVLAKAHPLTPILWFGPLIAYGLYRGVHRFGLLGELGLFVMGWLIWTLFEYVMHRFFFHLRADDSAKSRLRAFLRHGYHHEFPNDKLRLVAPPLMSWPLGAAIIAIYLWLLGPATAFALFAGTASGYIGYDWIHYYVHHFRPRTRLGRWLKGYHMHHHFDARLPNARFGVSTPLWDWVFGTYAGIAGRRGGFDVAPVGSRSR